MKHLTVFLSGVLFSTGLILSGMTQPGKVVGFLDVTGNWDPSLALVMLGAIGVHFVAFRWVMRRTTPVFATKFLIPQKTVIDAPLVVGAAIFGMGWGLGGYCPGPGIVSGGSGATHALLFVAAMIAGQWLYVGYQRLQALARSPEPSGVVPYPAQALTSTNARER